MIIYVELSIYCMYSICLKPTATRVLTLIFYASASCARRPVFSMPPCPVTGAILHGVSEIIGIEFRLGRM